MAVYAVAGSTGEQGGSVVQALLKRGLKVRGLTRNTSSPKAQELARRGVEMIVADFDKPETLQPAFEGVDGAFLVTNYWEYIDAEREIKQAKALFDAAKAAGVKHVVWSGLEDTRPDTEGKLEAPDGKYPVPHWDAKAVASQYLTQLGLPYTILLTSFFLDNFKNFDLLKPQPINGGGKYSIAANIGDAPMPVISTKDLGEVAAAILAEGPSKWAGKAFPIAGEHITWSDIAKVLSEVTGKDIVGLTPSDDEYVAALQRAGMPSRGAKDMANMFTYYRDWDTFQRNRPVQPAKTVHPGMQDTRVWAQEHKEALLKAMRA